MNKTIVDSILSKLNDAAWYDIGDGEIRQKQEVILYGDTADIVLHNKTLNIKKINMVMGQVIIFDRSAGSGLPRKLNITRNYILGRMNKSMLLDEAMHEYKGDWKETTPKYIAQIGFDNLKKKSTRYVKLSNLEAYILEPEYEKELKPKYSKLMFKDREYEVMDIDNENFTCGYCGNTQDSNGFNPCDSIGNDTEPNHNWDGFYKCNNCNRIYATKITGHKNKNTHKAFKIQKITEKSINSSEIVSYTDTKRINELQILGKDITIVIYRPTDINIQTANFKRSNGKIILNSFNMIIETQKVDFDAKIAWMIIEKMTSSKGNTAYIAGVNTVNKQGNTITEIMLAGITKNQLKLIIKLISIGNRKVGYTGTIHIDANMCAGLSDFRQRAVQSLLKINRGLMNVNITK